MKGGAAVYRLWMGAIVVYNTIEFIFCGEGGGLFDIGDDPDLTMMHSRPSIPPSHQLNSKQSRPPNPSAFPPTPFSHLLQHLLILGWKTVQRNENKAEPGATDHETRSAWRGRETERERESDGFFGRARQLGLPAMFAQGGLQLRVSSGREKRERQREEMRSVTWRYATRS